MLRFGRPRHVDERVELAPSVIDLLEYGIDAVEPPDIRFDAEGVHCARRVQGFNSAIQSLGAACGHDYTRAFSSESQRRLASETFRSTADANGGASQS